MAYAITISDKNNAVLDGFDGKKTLKHQQDLLITRLTTKARF